MLLRHVVLLLQGNYSDLLVQLSNVYSQLRGDTSGVKNEDSAQVSNTSITASLTPTAEVWCKASSPESLSSSRLEHQDPGSWQLQSPLQSKENPNCMSRAAAFYLDHPPCP